MENHCQNGSNELSLSMEEKEIIQQGLLILLDKIRLMSVDATLKEDVKAAYRLLERLRRGYH